MKMKNKNVKLFKDGEEVQVTFSTFPAGERYVKIENMLSTPDSKYVVQLLSADSTSIIDAVLLSDALRRIVKYSIEVTLETFYLPYSRQDRVCKEGESFSLDVIAEMLQNYFDIITTVDIHNKDSEKLFNYAHFSFTNKDVNYATEKFIKVNSNEILFVGVIGILADNTNTYIVSPDKGAVDRATRAMNELQADGLIIFDKVRIGNIVKTEVFVEDTVKLASADNLIVVDDICDGGATFISLAESIKKYNKKADLYLIVTHGIFSKGVSELEKYYKIICVDNEYNRLRLENKTGW
jgi:ribose-phosphate pyrophosphokinase